MRPVGACTYGPGCIYRNASILGSRLGWPRAAAMDCGCVHGWHRHVDLFEAAGFLASACSPYLNARGHEASLAFLRRRCEPELIEYISGMEPLILLEDVGSSEHIERATRKQERMDAALHIQQAFRARAKRRERAAVSIQRAYRHHRRVVACVRIQRAYTNATVDWQFALCRRRVRRLAANWQL